MTTRNQVYERTETHKSHVRFGERCLFILLGALVALLVDMASGMPHLAAITIGTLPEVTRETVELWKRL